MLRRSPSRSLRHSLRRCGLPALGLAFGLAGLGWLEPPTARAGSLDLAARLDAALPPGLRAADLLVPVDRTRDGVAPDRLRLTLASQADGTPGDLRAAVDAFVAGIERDLDSLGVPRWQGIAAAAQGQLGAASDPCADKQAQLQTGLGLVDRMLRFERDRGNRWSKRDARDVRAAVSEPLDRLVGGLLDAAALADCRTEAALHRIGAEEQAPLLAAVEASLGPRRPDAQTHADAALLGEAWARVDRGALVLAGLAWTEAVRDAAVALSALPADAWPGSPLILPTDLGEVWVGSPSPNSGTGDPALLIDPGGDDQWRIGVDREGFGGGAPRVRGWIDLAGNDTWLGGATSVGGAAFGVSAGLDLAGDDTVRTGALSQGGAAFGVATWHDRSGQDRLDAGVAAQGFAAYGLGVLRLGPGRDTVDGSSAAQGMALPGGLGLLLGGADDDRYDLAGGLGQGAAAGIGPTHGGVGLLLAPGADRISGGDAVQGAARDGGVGILVGGDGRYDAGQGVQGACAGAGAGVFVVAGDATGAGAGRALGPCRALARGPGDRLSGAAGGGGLALRLGPWEAPLLVGADPRQLPALQEYVGVPTAVAPQPTDAAGVSARLRAAPAHATSARAEGFATGAGNPGALAESLASLVPGRPHEAAFVDGVVDARTDGAETLLAWTPPPGLEPARLRWLARLAPRTPGPLLPRLAQLALAGAGSSLAGAREAAFLLAAAVAEAADSDEAAQALLPGLDGSAAARLLREPDIGVRAAIARVLARLGGPGAASGLADCLAVTGAHGPGLRAAAEDALGRISARSDGLAVARALYPLAEDGAGPARQAALRLLGGTGHAEAWEVLGPALDDTDEAARQAAIEGAVALRSHVQGKALRAIDERLTRELERLTGSAADWLRGELGLAE